MTLLDLFCSETTHAFNHDKDNIIQLIKAMNNYKYINTV